MDAERLDIDKTLEYLTLDEKLRMLCGDGMWHTFGAGELPRVRMADGPNGLRMADGAMSSAAPATCFPTPSVLANSWDPAVLYTVGAAIGKEATAMGVNLLLAPGLNIKRSPLGGRNFEYYSEDPILSGELGKAFVSGVQSTGVGACIKHFAANNQESYRMYSDSVVDMRALRELYLRPFEIAVQAEPAAVMCAYNKLNGTYCTENEFLLKRVLRGDFAYKGVTLSDWGAVHDRVRALKAGLDLEMPDSHGLFADSLKAALDSGEITENTIDESLRRILELTDNVYLEPYGDFDADAHDRISYNAAAASIVLLKNEGGMLPLTRDMRVVVCGELAENAPIQGGGSSHVTALKTVSPLEAFAGRSIEITYFRGYSSDRKENDRLQAEALDGAKNADAVLVYAGIAESHEGIDRKSLDLPPEQNELISKLAASGLRVTVVLAAPGAVTMPWLNRVRAVVFCGLCGGNGAAAAVDVLYGRINPRGRLAETFPLETPDFSDDFGRYRALYRESLFVGYRYYDAANVRVLFPFGHGLSYSDISYGDASLTERDNGFDVSVVLTNNSVRDGYETVQIYVSDKTGRVLCAPKQLAGFRKVFVEGKTSVTATVHIPRRAFMFFDTESDGYRTCDGEYTVIVAASAKDVRQELKVMLDGDYKSSKSFPDSYKTPRRVKLTDADFEALYGSPIPPEAPRPKKGEFTLDSCINDIKSTFAGKCAMLAVKKLAPKKRDVSAEEREAYITTAVNIPIGVSAAMSDGSMTVNTAKGLIEMANGKIIKGIKLMMTKEK